MADRGEVKIRQGRISDLISVYKASYKDIVSTIERATTAGKIRKFQTLTQIKKELQSLGVDVDKWVKEEIPQYYLDGVNVAVQDLKALGVDISRTANFSVINREAVKALTDDTALAFAEGLTGLNRSAGRILTTAQKRQLNFILAEGRLTGESRKVVAAAVRDQLRSQGLSVLVDRGGKQWSFEAYSDMLVRTKAVEARNQGLTNRMLASGYDLVQVSNHRSQHEACARWEGEILSLTGNTPGYKTVEDARSEGLFHPNCQHAINVLNPSLASKTKAYDNPFNYR